MILTLTNDEARLVLQGLYDLAKKRLAEAMNDQIPPGSDDSSEQQAKLCRDISNRIAEELR